MPFRLLVAMVTLSLIAPAIFGAWSSADYMQIDSRIRAEASRVLAAAQTYLQAGSGGERIDVSLRGGTFTRIEYVVFGDNEGHAYSHAIRYRLSGGEQQMIVAKDPPVTLVSPDGGELALGEGAYTLQIECIDGETITIRTG